MDAPGPELCYTARMDQGGMPPGVGARVPRIIARLDKSMRLTPAEGYLHSRIDGRRSLQEIAREISMDLREVQEIVERLATAGVVSTLTAEEEAATAEFATSVSRMPAAHARDHVDIVRGRYSDAELQEVCDLDTEQKKVVLDLFHALDDSDYYMLLGVPRGAEKKDVKAAYYRATKEVHPDKFFRKNLGSFKPKMELVFGTLTFAHDTLIDPKRRAEYDAYLAGSSLGMEAMLSHAVEQARQAPAPPPASAPAPASPPSSTAPQAAASAPPSTPSGKPADDAALRARREALARRLLGTKASSATVKAATPAAQPLQSKDDAMEAMKRRYEAQLDVASAEQAKVYAAAGAELVLKKNFVQAANSYRLALAMNPNDEAIKAAAADAFAHADEILVETYQKTARDEERNENWPEAARQWTRIAQIKTTDAVAADHAATAIHKARGDLRQAADLAKRAISLAPKQVGYRITLANVYIAAGMTQSAKHELEVALQLSPTNKQIPILLKSLKK